MNTPNDWRTPAPQRNTRVVILLDRSGSMQSEKQETIGGFNGYLDGLKDPNLKVTVVQFDTVGIDTLCDGKPPKDAARLNDDTYVCRGGTPLYDALGRTINRIQAEAGEDNVLFVTLTDGQENSSSEFTQDAARKLIKEREAKGWTFAYIGVGVDGWQGAAALSHGTMGSANVHRTAKSGGGIISGYNELAGATANYCASVGSDTHAVSKQGIFDEDDHTNQP